MRIAREGGGEVIEVSRDVFAIGKRTNVVDDFGEDVDIDEKGKVIGHEGARRAGEDGVRFGLAMPGSPFLRARYDREIFPGKAMDRVEVVRLSGAMEKPAGTFAEVPKTAETTPFERVEEETKSDVAGVGLLKGRADEAGPSRGRRGMGSRKPWAHDTIAVPFPSAPRTRPEPARALLNHLGAKSEASTIRFRGETGRANRGHIFEDRATGRPARILLNRHGAKPEAEYTRVAKMSF